MPFPQAPAGARRILGGWRRSGWLWCCGRSCWWCSRRMTKRSSPAGSGRGWRGSSERRVQSRSTPSEAKLFGLMGRRRVLLPHPGSATGHLIAPGDHHTLQHIQVHFGVDFQANFEDMRWHDVALIETTPKTISVARNFVFVTLRTSIDKIKENGFELTKKRSRRYPSKTITDADYADDIAILANTPNQPETLLNSLERAAAGIGLHVNAHKIHLPRKQRLINRKGHDDSYIWYRTKIFLTHTHTHIHKIPWN